MADIAELSVNVTARESVSAVLSRLESQLDRTNTSVEQIANGLASKLGNSQQKAAQSALAHAQAEARLQASSGNAAAGIRTLQAALDGVDRSSLAAIRAETQLVGMQSKLAKELSGSNQFVDAFKQGLFGFVAPAAAAATAINVLKSTAQSFVDAFNLKAGLDATTASVKSQLDGFRDAGATYAEASAFGRQYNITQAETNSILQSSVGSLRSSTASVSQLESALIRLQSKDVSKPISEAARALAELESGDVTSIKELFRVSAKDALGMRDAIVAGGDSVQVLTAYLDRTQTGMQALELRAQGAAGKLNELKVASEDLALAQAQFAEGPGLALLQARIAVTTGATRVLSGNFEDARRSITNAAEAGSFGFQLFDGILAGSLTNIATYQRAADQAAAAQTGIASETLATAAANDAYTAALAAGKSQADADAASNAAFATVLAATANAATLSTGAMQAAAAGQLAQAAAAQQAAAINQAAADSILTMTGNLDKNAQASVLAAAQSAAQKAAVDQLTESTNADVAAFLALNPIIDAAGIAAQVAAGKIPKLIGELAALRVEAYSTRDAVAALAAAQGLNVKSNIGPGGLGIGAPGLTSGKNNSVDAVVALQAANKKAADEAIQGDLAIAKAKNDTAAQIALIRKQQAGLNKDSLAYKQLQADIIGLEKGKGGKGGGGGGSAKLTDQQKLNNSLLNDQDAANGKFEDAERAHTGRLLDIEADYARKQREQLQQNEISKRKSQADFYDRLTSSELNKKKGGSAALKQIDADYQAAYQKSQELAQSGNAKLAADYLALKQQQADQELAYQEALAKAAEDKDQAEISRLQAIHALRQQANAEEEKQLLAGGDANVNARDQALADESTKYAESQDKIATSADRAADRKIAAAERAGKAIVAERLEVDKLGTSYDRIAPGAAAPSSATPTTTTTPADASAAAAPQTASDIVAAINAAKDALVAALGAVERAERDTGGKVAGLKNNGGIAG